jgi:GH15 family glucan-1,4-alpha-glucosidase
MYRSIEDYGLIGNLHSAALVSKEGSIDYCSLPLLDSPTIFASLLDDEKGGFFSLQPSEPFTSEQAYIKDSNILSCSFHSGNDKALLHDFMPVEIQGPRKKTATRIHRCLKVIRGNMRFILTLMPRPDYARSIPSITETEENFFVIRSGRIILTLAVQCRNAVITGNDKGTLKLSIQLEEEEEAHIDLSFGIRRSFSDFKCPFEETNRFWQKWIHDCMGERCTYLGEFAPMINRSLLVLKLLTFQPTGAIAASATTSLPETRGGERNWDYRFCWLRDASFTLKAFFSLGHITEADAFIQWLHATYRKYGSRNLQIMYTLRGKEKLKEKELSHLKGYCDSRPVRIGNEAYRQNQWDIYGEVMDSSLRLSDYAGRIDEDLWPFFSEICNLAIENWQKPDDGIWEVRNGPQHFVYSKVMCWVTLDRGITIARRFGFDAPLDRWTEQREAIKADVLAKGFDREKNSFVQKYGSDDLDASLLLLPLSGFLPIDDPRMQGTIAACQRELMHRGFLLRYRTEDGLKGEEGGFLLCNFWLVECLARSGKSDRAMELLNETLKASNHLGLFSEEFDSVNSRMLGNFPQAFSHIGYINAVMAILSSAGRLAQTNEKPLLADRLRKLIPFRVTLNKGRETVGFASPATSGELKKMLGMLQGAFFDSEKGKVDYEAMKRSEGFNRYLILAQSLAAFDLDTLRSDNEKKAFWINIYNILIIHGVIEFDIHGSVLEVVNFFCRIGYDIGGHFFTPDDIEHGILRGNLPPPLLPFAPFSPFDPRLRHVVSLFDFRIHFALVCAAASCPPVEFYDAPLIDRQLDTAARSFLNRQGLEIDRKNKTVWLSPVFEWYRRDFGSNNRDTLVSILPYLQETDKEWIENNLTSVRIRHLSYNWNLNSTLLES